jgi:hypothetical protein
MENLDEAIYWISEGDVQEIMRRERGAIYLSRK